MDNSSETFPRHNYSCGNNQHHHGHLHHSTSKPTIAPRALHSHHTSHSHHQAQQQHHHQQAQQLINNKPMAPNNNNNYNHLHHLNSQEEQANGTGNHSSLSQSNYPLHLRSKSTPSGNTSDHLMSDTSTGNYYSTLQLKSRNIPSDTSSKCKSTSTLPRQLNKGNLKSAKLSMSSPLLPLTAPFEVTLKKKDGTLGFTIYKKQEDGMFYIRSVINEPAINDPAISPGDKILRVNGIDVSSLSHSSAISFLRSLPDIVTLKLEPVIPEDVSLDMEQFNFYSTSHLNNLLDHNHHQNDQHNSWQYKDEKRVEKAKQVSAIDQKQFGHRSGQVAAVGGGESGKIELVPRTHGEYSVAKSTNKTSGGIYVNKDTSVHNYSANEDQVNSVSGATVLKENIEDLHGQIMVHPEGSPARSIERSNSLNSSSSSSSLSDVYLSEDVYVSKSRKNSSPYSTNSLRKQLRPEALKMIMEKGNTDSLSRLRLRKQKSKNRLTNESNNDITNNNHHNNSNHNNNNDTSLTDDADASMDSRSQSKLNKTSDIVDSSASEFHPLGQGSNLINEGKSELNRRMENNWLKDEKSGHINNKHQSVSDEIVSPEDVILILPPKEFSDGNNELLLYHSLSKSGRREVVTPRKVFSSSRGTSENNLPVNSPVNSSAPIASESSDSFNASSGCYHQLNNSGTRSKVASCNSKQGKSSSSSSSSASASSPTAAANDITSEPLVDMDSGSKIYTGSPNFGPGKSKPRADSSSVTREGEKRKVEVKKIAPNTTICSNPKSNPSTSANSTASDVKQLQLQKSQLAKSGESTDDEQQRVTVKLHQSTSVTTATESPFCTTEKSLGTNGASILSPSSLDHPTSGATGDANLTATAATVTAKASASPSTLPLSSPGTAASNIVASQNTNLQQASSASSVTHPTAGLTSAPSASPVIAAASASSSSTSPPAAPVNSTSASSSTSSSTSSSFAADDAIPSLAKWRGANLVDHLYLAAIRDEQDSGFGDSVTPRHTLDKPLQLSRLINEGLQEEQSPPHSNGHSDDEFNSNSRRAERVDGKVDQTNQVNCHVNEAFSNQDDQVDQVDSSTATTSTIINSTVTGTTITGSKASDSGNQVDSSTTISTDTMKASSISALAGPRININNNQNNSNRNNNMNHHKHNNNNNNNKNSSNIQNNNQRTVEPLEWNYLTPSSTSSTIPTITEVPVEVCLEKGWSTRLGIQLQEDTLNRLPVYTVVKSIVPQTIASADGRIKEGWRLISVNSVSLEGQSVKEVVEYLRKIKGRLNFCFLAPVNNTS